MRWLARPEVAADLAAAASWYEAIAPALSEAFFAEYETAVRRVQETPASTP